MTEGLGESSRDQQEVTWWRVQPIEQAVPFSQPREDVRVSRAVHGWHKIDDERVTLKAAVCTESSGEQQSECGFRSFGYSDGILMIGMSNYL